MPIYALQCQSKCGHEEDIYRSIAERDRDLPLCCGAHMIRKIVAPMVAPDISAYQAIAVDVATGKAPVINSRSAHRDFLKRNGYTEVGNERVGRQQGEVRGDFNVRGDLTKATREVLGKQK
ncbi:zinc ribbon domain-containing protein [Pandoraea sp. XJJ-1]|uniref:zinc ribbon domain-containing protein n=1 Tax=Pandoraea sp. XJJ-1 TaxID=3002643 RepID=UPI00228186B0|nr:zinc ribbon domain-containing protein [Pandoraea sp. XJJ-1]WAL81321.1 zinc ribbon domain-containing protein [Pandoraea sp. XJJ-1]